MAAWQGSHSTGFPPAARRAILARDRRCRCSGCRRCASSGCRRPSTTADHITPVAEGGSDGVDNGQGLCSPCHDTKTQTEAARGRARNAPRRQPERHPGLT